MEMRGKKFKYSHNLLWQSFAATVCVFLLLWGLEVAVSWDLLWVAGASALASTTFIVFAMPTCGTAHPYRILLSYILAFAIGALFHWLAKESCHWFFTCHPESMKLLVFDVGAALALFVTFYLICAFRVAHPPALGMSIVVALKVHDIELLSILLGGVVFIAIVRWIFKKHLRDLVC